MLDDFPAIDFSVTSDFLAVDLTDDFWRQLSPSLHLVALVAPNGVRQSQFAFS